MAWRKSPPKLVEHFYEVMDAFPKAEKKKMFGYPCCFLNGNMFTGLHQENWVVRLNEADREEISQAYGATIFEPMAGRKMKEYILLPETIISDPTLLRSWVERSVGFAESLPPKS